jgi:hypothetical protein
MEGADALEGAVVLFSNPKLYYRGGDLEDRPGWSDMMKTNGRELRVLSTFHSSIYLVGQTSFLIDHSVLLNADSSLPVRSSRGRSNWLGDELARWFYLVGIFMRCIVACRLLCKAYKQGLHNDQISTDM